MQPRRVWSLVVDDCLEQGECLARLLEALGHSATFVINPFDAIDAVDALHPEVVFIDIDMPQVNGWALARMLRARRDGEGRSAFFDAYLVKPVTVEALTQEVAVTP